MAQRTLSRRSRERDEEENEYQTDPDEAPRRGRGRNRDEEDEAPRRGRGRSARDEQDDDEPPRRSRGSRRSRDEDAADDEPRRGRRSRDDEEERKPTRPNSVGRGWGAFSQKRREFSDYVDFYELPEKQAEIIKVLDDEPFAVYAEHWIDEMPKGKKKSYICLEEDCPLCNAGDKPRVYSLFNVVDLRDPSKPVVVPWRLSQTVADVLQGYDQDDRSGPVNRPDVYFSIKKSSGGRGGRQQTNLAPVKERDLKDDWQIDPLSDQELDAFDGQRYDADDVLTYSKRQQLKDIANEYLL